MSAVITEAESVPRGLPELQPEAGTRLLTRPITGSAVEVTASANDARPGLSFEVDLADAVGYWHPGPRSGRALPPDWSGSTVTSLVHGAPVGALYDADGEVLLGWAAAEGIAELSVQFGVSEEHKTFAVKICPTRPLTRDLVLLVDTTHDNLAETVRRLGAWLSNRCAGAVLEPPAIARLPVYSTWYTFTQDINDDLVTDEAALARELGCGSVFIDDGWQQYAHGRGYQGCGDWLPDLAKFPNLTSTVKNLHDYDAAAALWIAPLLIGRHSQAFGTLADFAPHWEAALNCHVLDPRHPEVRAHVADICLRLADNYDADLLKIDFLDRATAYAETAGGGDIADVGEAMAAMLGEVRTRLADAGHGDVVFEFRQPYVSPAIARFGQILRANDCPADSVVNRTTSIDARLLSVGQIVHTDPMMWGIRGGVRAVAQQLYAGWFAVPQISMRLSDLPPEQLTALRGLLALWRQHSDVTLDGVLYLSGAERGYDLVSAVRADLDRSVIACYSPLVVDLDAHPTAETTVINATPTERLVLRTSRPIADGVVRSANGTEVAPLTPATPGLIELAVPAYGSTTIST